MSYRPPHCLQYTTGPRLLLFPNALQSALIKYPKFTKELKETVEIP